MIKLRSYEEMIGPLLAFLAGQSGSLKAAQVYEGLADHLGLTDEQRRRLLPSGVQPVYKNRIGWAQDALKRNGFSYAPKWGYWEITPEGRALLDADGGSLSETRAHEIATTNRTKPISSTNEDEETRVDLGGPAATSPEEMIETGLAEIESTVARELLDLIGSSSPEFFEQLVLDLLHAMGYGASRSALQRVGGSGDGGIDGIISLDRLGLEKVYVQAKRWKGQVGSPVIQGFVGALQLHGATKGVLITAGAITSQASKTGERANVVLIDGDRLTRLMIEYGLGVSARTLRIPRIDSDYFHEV
jgi:restriction system protein